MRMKIVFVSLFVFACAGAAFSQSYDIPVNTAARMNAMANSGSAVVDGGAAVAMNPAGLANIKQLQVEATFNNMILTMEQPANGSHNHKTVHPYSAIGLFGIGYRLSELVTVGFLLYAPSGGGAESKDVTMGQEGPFSGATDKVMKGYLVFLEFGPCIALNLPGNLRLGFVYRFNYVENWSKMYNFPMDQTARAVYSKTHLNGYGFTGFRVGLQWDPLTTLHLGFAYRSFVKLNVEGKTRSEIMMVPGRIDEDRVDQTQRYADGLVAGISYDVIPSQLAVHFDYAVNFWSRYKALTTHTEGIGDTTTPIRNHDVHVFRVGTEYWITQAIALRGGFAFSTQHADPRYQNPTSSGAPGPAYTLACGAGFKLGENWDFDLAINYMINQGRVTDDQETTYSVAGPYKNNGFFIGLGARFHI